MIHRILSQKVAAAAGKMPVIVITGPRQSGKSTLVRQVFPAYRYINLEVPSSRRFAEEDPEGFLRSLGNQVILDEIQQVPDLLSYIQAIVDEARIPGQFILSGSQNLLLLESVSQSLAGRVAIFSLLPFSLEEIQDTPFGLPEYEHYLLKGFYPRIYDLDLNPTEWLLDYIQTYVERDLRQVINVSNLSAFRQFLEVCAGRIGKLVNLSDMGSLVGISHTTAQKWLSVLQTSYIVHLLRPYHRNYNKRIVKTPKLYFYDTGLACALLNLRSEDDLNRHFAKGALFENFVINELLKNHINRHLHPGSYFWNAAGNHEIDLLLDKGGRLYPIEIKAARTISAHFFDNLRYFQALSGARPEESFLVYGGDAPQQRSVARVLSWRQLGAIPL